ncbi:cell division protein FtsW [Modicisalibacter ilicicola DSM 19980]|uniref:Probable peptidoglycan glycosyltransferase FtsW n=1 Tax=Modicisalibacter ilicicola DSM 19980 TaxID=1121942 RepID=A0A1M5C5Q1_9GAMM|nr:putative lipid II flippase FtsW [Halomonas ilicicola]SHF50083.1 cell division protein FtsW [Halomonas ilicicola DSM 19980]
MTSWAGRFSTVGQPFDSWLLLAVAFLLLTGLVMVTSASTEIATALTGNPFYYGIRHAVFVLFALGLGLVTLKIPLAWWQRNGPWLLVLGFLLLILVLLVGTEVNGSKRWIPLGPINVQASELAKLFLIVYVAGYLERFLPGVRRHLWEFAKPLLVLLPMAVLLILEPDYGALVVMTSCVMGMLLLAGAPLLRFILLMVVVLLLGGYVAIAEPYRLERITSFANPWADMYDSGYQLTQALIAYGRGHWLGLGLGDSVQKLFYLPEAHTDFVFAVIAEELGLVGAVTVIGFFALLVYRALAIGRRAELARLPFAAYLSYGIALVFGAQAFINIGVSTGMLPTKGLTLPLLSYGGSSLVVSCIMVALLLRVDVETRRLTRYATSRQKVKGAPAQ